MATELRKAFSRTLPVMTGYIFLGTAYGISMRSKGFGIGLTSLISIFVYGGSLQFALMDYLTQAFAPVTLLLLTVLIQARHIFYGLSMLEPYRKTGFWKPYLIFALTDETYSLVCMDTPEHISQTKWFAVISLLDHLYWIFGSVLGAWLGQQIPMDYLQGIDFSMTALFLVIVTNQTMESLINAKMHRCTYFEALYAPALGAGTTLICLLIFGADSFLVFSMIGMLLLLYIRFRSGEEKTYDFD